MHVSLQLNIKEQKIADPMLQYIFYILHIILKKILKNKSEKTSEYQTQ